MAPTTRTRSSGVTSERFARAVAVTAGAVFLLPGLWAFFAPAAFFDAAAPFEPLNIHFVRDLGAFQIGLGAVLLLAAAVRDALLVALAGVGIGASFHLVGHLIDRDLGGDPSVDIPLFGLVAAALLVGATARAVDRRRDRGRGPAASNSPGSPDAPTDDRRSERRRRSAAAVPERRRG
jgi:hypothetical protein